LQEYIQFVAYCKQAPRSFRLLRETTKIESDAASNKSKGIHSDALAFIGRGDKVTPLHYVILSLSA
jgi:hypothetical protein